METTPTAEVLTEIGAPDPQGGGSGQVGERVELAGRRSLGLHGGEASGSTRLKKKKGGKANLLRHTLSTFHHNWGLFLLD